MTRKTASLGSISTGTLLDSDLIDAFSRELKHLRGSLPRELEQDVAKFNRNPDEFEFAAVLVSNLAEALNEYAPAYCYFGSHPGDDADFGFWPVECIEESLRNDGALFVSDTSEVPRGYMGIVAHINDHGNLSIYRATTRGLRELVSMV